MDVSWAMCRVFAKRFFEMLGLGVFGVRVLLFLASPQGSQLGEGYPGTLEDDWPQQSTDLA